MWDVACPFINVSCTLVLTLVGVVGDINSVGLLLQGLFIVALSAVWSLEFASLILEADIIGPDFVVGDDVAGAIRPIPESSDVDATELADIPELLFIVAVEKELPVAVFDTKKDFLEDGDKDFVLEVVMLKLES